MMGLKTKGVACAAAALFWLLAAALPGEATAGGFNYRITDPLVGNTLDDLNRDFWDPWSNPTKATEQASISSDGFTLSGHLNYLGWNNSGSAPPAKWVFGGDFRISIHIKSGNSSTRRNHVTLYEVIGCSELGKGLAGLWGGQGVQIGNSNDDHYPMAADSSAYYLFVKKDASLKIYKGDDQGVSEADEAVIDLTLPNPDAMYMFYLGVGSPNDNTMTAKDFILETEKLESCPTGTSPPAAWASAEGSCSCKCKDGSTTSARVRVVDPMVGSTLADLNREFWDPWSNPTKATEQASISSDGLTLSGHLNYLGWNNSGSAPPAKWVFGGDFSIKIHVTSGDSSTRRNHVTLYEVVECSKLGKDLAGLWGGQGAQIGNSNDDHYPMAADSSAYYLFVKKDAQLKIYKGDDQGVTEADEAVVDLKLKSPDGDFMFYLGVGSPNDNTMTAKDFILEADRLGSCPTGATPPASWCGCPADCEPTSGGGNSDGGSGGNSDGGSGSHDGGGSGGDDDGGGCALAAPSSVGPALGLLTALLLLGLLRRRG